MSDWIAGLQAIAEAARLVRAGEASLILAGGADVGVLPLVYASYEQAGLLTDEPGRSQFVPGDGAAIFVIEEREAALVRGATILAELEGDASCAWADDGSTLARSVDVALRDAGWADMEMLFVPATGHRELDAADRQLMRDLLARQSGKLEIFESASVRRAIGFPLAAASTIDLGLALSGTPARRRRAVATATGFMGQAAALSLTLFPEAS
jgi:3-oxoacyl-(acyl-carrier-protein) synthase